MARRQLAVLAVVLLGASSASAAGPPPTDDRALPTIAGRSSVSRIEPRFSGAASTLAGKPVEVRCWNQADWSGLDDEWRASTGTGLLAMKGYTRKSQPGTMHLSPLVCARLVAFTYSKARPTKRNVRAQEDLAVALGVLAHEAQHSAGILDEATAECYGLQRVRPLARTLGASRDYAAFMARVAWKQLYPLLPANYRSPECRNDGALDLNPRTNTWP